MELLSDSQAEVYCGGRPLYPGIGPVVTTVTISTGDVFIAPEVDVVTATQVNSNAIVVAFGGYKSSLVSNVASYQLNGIA